VVTCHAASIFVPCVDGTDGRTELLGRALCCDRLTAGGRSIHAAAAAAAQQRGCLSVCLPSAEASILAIGGVCSARHRLMTRCCISAAFLQPKTTNITSLCRVHSTQSCVRVFGRISPEVLVLTAWWDCVSAGMTPVHDTL